MDIVVEVIYLYSTGCPKCKVLEKKLQDKGISYGIKSDIEEMTALGITQVPVLKVNDKLLQFKEAVDWVNKQ